MRRAVLAVLLLSTLASFAQDAQKSSVTLGLDDYEKLRQTPPSATVIDTILLAGSFRERGLTITLNGRSTGTRPVIRALEQTHDVTISECSGAAILSRVGKGSFDLIPLAETFEVRCQLRISGSDRLRMHVPAGVLAVRSAVADGELVVGDEDDGGARDTTLVRHVSGPGQTVAATATGRYLITLLPDATRFRYSIDVHNPNRTTSSVTVALQSNEHLQQVDSVAPYEVNGNQYNFAIPPGDSSIAMTGELRGSSFVAPVRASLQYVVLESHPLLRPSVKTPAKRISLGETGVTPQYRGALAFETGSDRMTWDVKRLEAMHTTSYALDAAFHTLFIPIDGPVLGESSFQLGNEGAAELMLPERPEPTYVALGNEPILMTKNAQGQLTVPLSQDDQNVLEQHRQPIRRVAGFAIGSVDVPKLDVAATHTYLRLTYPDAWVPLYQSFASRALVWTPAAADLILFIALVLSLERLLAWCGVRATSRFAIAALASFAACVVNTFLIVVVVAIGTLTIIYLLSLPMRRRITYAIILGAVAFALVLATLGSKISHFASKEEYAYTRSVDSVTTTTMNTDTAGVTGAGAARPDAGKASAPPVLGYQGLPAKFTLPGGDRASSFSQDLLRVDRPQRATIVAISASLTNWIGLAIGIVAVILVWRDRRIIAAAVRRVTAPKVEDLG